MPSDFQYENAFGRNLGLVSEAEQDRLRRLRVALPGLGGVGGAHLQTLARMGVGAFHLADPDIFEVVNFNRQLGASMNTIGHGKAEVMAGIAREINPQTDVKTFADGITVANIGAFLDGVDVVVDGIEFFRIEDRRLLYRAARERGIPVVNAGPIGFGAALIVFTPQSVSFDEHFGLSDDMTHAEMILAFGLGLGPGLKGDIDPSRVDMENEKGPALASACMLCAAAAATEVLKLVTGRGRLSTPDRAIYVDLLRNRTLRLHPTPSLRHSLRGRLMRWSAFRRMPALARMHQCETDKLKAPTDLVTAESTLNSATFPAETPSCSIG